MDHTTINTVLSAVQILVGLLTFGGVIYHMGKHTAKLDRAQEDITGLVEADATHAQNIHDLSTRTSVLEALMPQEERHRRAVSHE